MPGTDFVLPRGGLVRASAAYHRSEDVPGRAWGLYMDPFWAPTWPSRMLPWENMALPVDFDEAVEAMSDLLEQYPGDEDAEALRSEAAAAVQSTAGGGNATRSATTPAAGASAPLAAALLALAALGIILRRRR